MSTIEQIESHAILAEEIIRLRQQVGHINERLRNAQTVIALSLEIAETVPNTLGTVLKSIKGAKKVIDGLIEETDEHNRLAAPTIKP